MSTVLGRWSTGLPSGPCASCFPSPWTTPTPRRCTPALDASAPEDRPFVLVNMIESIDGGAVVDGVSGGLGGEADKIMFRAVRAVPDIILVAGPDRQRRALQRRPGSARRAGTPAGSGASRPRPASRSITGQLSVDLSLSMFTDPGTNGRWSSPPKPPRPTGATRSRRWPRSWWPARQRRPGRRLAPTPTAGCVRWCCARGGRR